MARATLTKTLALGLNPTLYTANAADMTMTAADASNLNQYAPTGRELVVAHNTGGSPYTITITTSADPTSGRTGDITTYSLGAGEYAVFGPFPVRGYIQSDGYVYLQASNAAVKFGIVTLPG